MWENETVVLVTSLKKRILGGRERVRYERIQTDDAIPGFIKRLFKDRVELYLIKESPLTLQNTPHFNLDPTELHRLKDQSRAVLVGAATFVEKEVETLLQEALVLRLEFLIKPVTTLRNRLFQKGDSVPMAQVEDALEPFKKTLPYGDYLLRACQTQGLTVLGEAAYASILESMISQQAAQDAVAWLVREFTVLTDYISESKGEEITRLDGQVVRDFLADRSQGGFRRAVEVEVNLGRHDFTAADLEMTLRRYQELRTEFVAEPLPSVQTEGPKQSLKEVESPIPVPADEFKSPVEDGLEAGLLDLDDGWDTETVLAPEPVKVQDKPDVSILEEPEFLLEAEPEEKKKVASVAAPVEEPVTVEAPEEDPTEEDKPPKGMRIIRREPVEVPAESREKVAQPQSKSANAQGVPLRPLIDNRTEKSFVKKLFGGDAEAYANLLDKLEEAESWRVAKILIDNELFKRDVDPFSREAIKLVDLVYGRYYPEENVGGQ